MAASSVQYVKVRPVVEPSVTDAAVISTFPGLHPAGGSVIITSGLPGVEMVTSAEGSEVHPRILVTVKVYSPPSRPVSVNVTPDPAVVTLSGSRVIIHAPEAGSPLRTALPVGTASVGCVTVPIVGAEGVAG